MRSEPSQFHFNSSGFFGSGRTGSTEWYRDDEGYGTPDPGRIEGINSDLIQQNTEAKPSEEWADMFLYWVYNAFDSSNAGVARQTWMNEQMPSFINDAYRRSVGASTLLGREPEIGEVITDRGLNLNVRSTTNTINDNNVINGIRPNTEINILGFNKDDPNWIAIEYGSSVGWVSRDAVNIADSVELEDITQNCLDWLSGLISGSNPCQNSESYAEGTDDDN